MSFCVAILAALAWSNIFTLSGSLSFEKGYLNIDTTKTCNVDTTYINCSLENGLAYYSTLDTAIAVFFQPRYSIGAVVVPSPITTGVVNYSHTFTQVMRYEFMNWVDWGIIVMDRDSAQRLLDRILPDSISIESRVINHKKVCDVDPSQCVGWGAYGGGAEGVISDEQASRLPTKKVQIDQASIPAETPASEQPGDTTSAADTTSADTSASAGDSSAAADSLGNPLWFTKSAPLAGSVTQGMQYRVFDMNGIYLYEDRWRGSIKALGRPVIVRFGNGLTKVFR